MEEKARYVIKTPDGENIEVTRSGADLVSRNGRKLLCSCTGSTQETATPFITKLQEDKLACPLCGKTLKIIKTPADFAVEVAERERVARENLQVSEVNYSWETGIRLYALSARIDRADWEKVKHLFSFWRATEEEEDDEEWEDRYVGWATRRPDEVEKILKIPEERSLAFRREEANKTKEIEKERIKQERDKIAEVEKAFENAEYVDPRIESPAEAEKYQKGYEKMRVDGEETSYPGHERNIYGGGAWFVLQKEWIWKIENNGADGDAWDRNNVETGGAGAIGVRIPFDDDIASKIRGMKLFTGSQNR